MNTITETTKRLWYCPRVGMLCEYGGEQYCRMTVCKKEHGIYKTCTEIIMPRHYGETQKEKILHEWRNKRGDTGE